MLYRRSLIYVAVGKCLVVMSLNRGEGFEPMAASIVFVSCDLSEHRGKSYVFLTVYQITLYFKYSNFGDFKDKMQYLNMFILTLS